MADQASGLRQQMRRKENKGQAKTISIVSGKGGVGKSNVAVNFSLELINQGKKVLLFDLDIGMGNIDILLGLHAEWTVADMLESRMPIDAVIEKGPGGLAYIAGGSALTGLFKMNDSKLDYFLTQYYSLMQVYDYIIFDMGAGAAETSMGFILASDKCFVITTPEPTALRDAYGMVKQIIYRQAPMQLYVLVNRAQSERSGLNTLEGFKQIADRFLHVKMHSLGVLPEDNIVRKAVIQQRPYISFKEKANISKAMKQLVSNFISGSREEIDPKPFSFVQKLKQMMTVR